MDGAADGERAGEPSAGSSSAPSWKDSAMAAEITRLAERREEMKKERKTLVKELKNKRKRMCRLKRKASQLTDTDLFDIVRSRHLRVVEDTPPAAERRGENDVAAEAAAEGTE